METPHKRERKREKEKYVCGTDSDSGSLESGTLESLQGGRPQLFFSRGRCWRCLRRPNPIPAAESGGAAPQEDEWVLFLSCTLGPIKPAGELSRMGLSCWLGKYQEQALQL